jgi:regulation of enolase protein 1 (concanavalin A-like superfamily)
MARAGGFFYGDITNVLLRNAPEGDFELETRVNFRPGGNYQFAGLVIYDDPKNTVTFGRAFCDNPNCAGDGFYLDMTTGGTWVGENFATKAPDVDIVYLRLRRVGDAFAALASTDGSDWTVIGTHRRVSNPLFVGILAGQAWGSVPKPAQFDYFAMYTIR